MGKARLGSVLAALAAIAAGCGGGGGGARGLTPVSGAGSAPPAGARADVAFEVIAEGEQSGITASGEVLAADDGAWQSLWAAHAPATAAPSIDFTADAVVAAFMGQQPNLGYATEVARIQEVSSSGDLVATVRTFAPGPWRAVAHALSQPFHMVRLAQPAPGARLFTARQARLDFEEILAGSQSPIGQGDPSYAGEVRALRDQASFDALWAQHASGQPAPALDFAREMAVAVLAGFHGSFGHHVETLRVLHDAESDEVRVDAIVHPYRGGAAPPPVTETPFQILRVAKASGAIRAEVRSTGPVADVYFSGDDARHGGGERIFVVRDAATYGQLAATYLPAIPKIGFDFTQTQVLIVLLGTRSTTGWTMSVRSVSMFEDGDIEAEIGYVAPTRPTAQASSPFILVRMPRTHGPVAVRFVDRTPVP